MTDPLLQRPLGESRGRSAALRPQRLCGPQEPPGAPRSAACASQDVSGPRTRPETGLRSSEAHAPPSSDTVCPAFGFVAKPEARSEAPARRSGPS